MKLLILALSLVALGGIAERRQDVWGAEKVPPAYVPEQSQASALAVPAPSAAEPVAVVVVTVCNQIVGIVASDTEGVIHPLNIEGLGDGQLKSIIAKFKQRLVVDAGCKVEPDKQPIF